MKASQVESIFRQTLEDKRLSRGERKAIQAVIEENQFDSQEIAKYLNLAFSIAKEAIKQQEAKEIVDWVEEVVKTFRHFEQSQQPSKESIAETYFSPGEECVQKLCSLIKQSQRAIDVCVFTITDNRISDLLLDADKRGIKLRIITDNDKAHDLGSDTFRLQEEGLLLRVDRSEFHMHHKFAIFDNALLLTGSYNWTRSAALHNQENFIVSNHQNLIKNFQKTFETLWKQFA